MSEEEYNESEETRKIMESVDGIPENTDFDEAEISDDQIKAYIKKLKVDVLVAHLTAQQLAARCGNYSQDTGSKNKAADRAMKEARRFATRQLSLPTSPYAVQKINELANFSDPSYDWKSEVQMATFSEGF